MTPDTAKPVPVADHDSQTFWDACKKHELRAQRCSKCGRFRWPPKAFCPNCYSWDHEWSLLSGRGTVYSFSIVHHSVAPAFKDELPYAVALIELDGSDGHVRILSNVIDCPVEDVRVGLPVQVVFEDRSSDVTVALFKPADAK